MGLGVLVASSATLGCKPYIPAHPSHWCTVPMCACAVAGVRASCLIVSGVQLLHRPCLHLLLVAAAAQQVAKPVVHAAQQVKSGVKEAAKDVKQAVKGAPQAAARAAPKDVPKEAKAAVKEAPNLASKVSRTAALHAAQQVNTTVGCQLRPQH